MWRLGSPFLFIAFMAVSAQSLLAQDFLMPDGRVALTDSSRWLFQAGAHAFHGSNAVPVGIANRFLFGGFIDEELKDAFTGKMSGTNRLLFGYDFGAQHTFNLKNKTYAISIGFGTFAQQRAHFSADAAELIFRGNAHFGDQEAKLDGLMWTDWGFTKYQFGLVHKASGSYAKMGMYQGTSRTQWQLDRGSLTTVYSDDQIPFAERLMLQAEGFENENALASEALLNKGIGIGLDAAWVTRQPWGTWQVGMSDLGIMRWQNVARSDTSGSFQFGGFDLSPGNGSPEDLFVQLRDSILPGVESIGLVQELMPFLVSILYISPKMNERYFGRAQIGYRHQLNTAPWLDLRACMAYGNGSTLWLAAFVSDFAPVQVGIGIQQALGKAGFLAMHLNHLNGMLSTNSRARGIQVQYLFRL